MWEIVYAKQIKKDARNIISAGLKDAVEELVQVLKQDPFQNPPPYKKILGDLKGVYSRRITIKHRLVYEVFTQEKIVRLLRMVSHE